ELSAPQRAGPIRTPRRRRQGSPQLAARRHPRCQHPCPRPPQPPDPQPSPALRRAVPEAAASACTRSRRSSPSSASAPPLFLLLLDQLIQVLRQLPHTPLQRRDPLSCSLEILPGHQPRRAQRFLLRLVERLLRPLQPADRRRDRLRAPRILEELAHRLHAELGGALAQRLGSHGQAVYTNSVGTARMASSPAAG